MWGLVEYVQRLWPFSFSLLNNDLKVSDRIVKNLPIPDSTKNFVYAFQEPESEAVIYVLSVQNLSERSVLDIECLIRAIKPDAVVVQLGDSGSSDQTESGIGLIDGVNNNSGEKNGGCVVDVVPTSVFEVLMSCFVNKIGRETYEDVAGSFVLKEIFGVSFNGNFLAAKKVAEEAGSSFLTLKLPLGKCGRIEDGGGEVEVEDVNVGSGFGNAFGLKMNNLVPGRMGGPVVSTTNSRAFHIMDDVQAQMLRSLSSCFLQSNLISKFSVEEARPLVNYDAPQFAKGVYPLLLDLHDFFVDIPSMGTALACAQKMLSHVNKGEPIDSCLLSEVCAFQIAVEGLRIALNNAGRLTNKPISINCKFFDLPIEDQSHAILAQALRSQTGKYKSLVAVIDASGLAGLRKHWNTTIPVEVKDMIENLINCGESNDNDELQTNDNSKRLLSDKPVVAVGAGATAIFGISSLSKVIPTSTFIKVVTFPVPASVKLLLTQTQKAISFAFGKTLGPTKLVAPGMASSTMKSSALKAIASAEKIRALAHTVIASAEKTSISAMRTAFYEIMRSRRVKPIGVLPWATFGCSVATCGSLLMYGDGIECVAESFPVAPSIAILGRGIQNLHEVAASVREAESSRIQNSIDELLRKFKNLKVQNK